MTSHAGFACLIGEPNVGKSTLLNRIVGNRISIVTHKAQTTRARVRGIVQRCAAQIVFVDTPGIFKPRRGLDQAMVADAWRGAADADANILLIASERGITPANHNALTRLAKFRCPLAIAFNKIDLIERPHLLSLVDEIRHLAEIDAIFMICARRGDGVEDLVSWAAAKMPPGPWLYPDDMIGDMRLRDAAAEITREKLMLSLHDEIPYQLTVETESWTETGKHAVRIEQIVYVTRDSHRRMIIGAGGRVIKSIGTASRRAIAKFLGMDVQLFVHVRTRPGWMKEKHRYESIGLNIADIAPEQ